MTEEEGYALELEQRQEEEEALAKLYAGKGSLEDLKLCAGAMGLSSDHVADEAHKL